jgi:hypothetical protein
LPIRYNPKLSPMSALISTIIVTSGCQKNDGPQIIMAAPRASLESNFFREITAKYFLKEGPTIQYLPAASNQIQSIAHGCFDLSRT